MSALDEAGAGPAVLGAARAGSAGAGGFDPRRIAPDLVRALALLAPGDFGDLERVRRETESDVLAWDPHVRIRQVTVPGPPGGGPVGVQLYDGRRDAGDCAGIVHIHGGAFVSGDPNFEHRRSLALAAGGRCIVASVDYRLAPEHPYPAGLEDCGAVLAWLHARAGELGIDPDRIGVAGSSAGACLAAALALRARDNGGPPVGFQILVYPVLDHRATTASVSAFAAVPGFCGRNVSEMWSLYLAGQAPDEYASPALATDLTGLPPAYISAAEFDPLRDEALAYAGRLLAADVPVELRVFPGTWHGFDLLLPDAPSAQEFSAAEVAALRRMIGLRR